MAPETRQSYQSVPRPTPGELLVPTDFSPSSQTEDSRGYILNHTALQVRSVSASLDFYVGFLGMSLILATNAGPFTAYYLGYPQDTDTSPADMAKSSGLRSGILELIFEHSDEVAQEKALAVDGENAMIGTDNPEDTKEGSRERPEARPPRFGFAHIGIRVPDVGATLLRAEQQGWRVLTHLHDVTPKDMPLPSWTGRGHQNCGPRYAVSWQGGFEDIFGQIGFVEDPDGNRIEILPREIKRTTS